MDDSRIQCFQSQLKTACLIEDLSDLFYLTGLSLSKGKLLVTQQEATLFVDGRYYEKAKKEAPCLVKPFEEFRHIQEKRISFDSASITYESFLALKERFGSIEWIPLSKPLKEIRAIKDAAEIKALRRSADLTWKGYQHILHYLKEGVSEEEIALEFEIFCRKNGASGLSFEPIIAFGENSAYPHHRAGRAQLKKNQVVLIDVGAVVDHYHGDMTRLFYFGHPDPQIVYFEQIVKRAKTLAMQHIKPGIKVKELDQLVLAEFDRANVKQLYIHSLGHGIGLETHEYPRLKVDGEDQDVVLKAGMVFTIEPGLYQPGLGGVRLEDMLLVTETGYENLFPDV
jgi:Xaa-Pro aminopeptidase